MKKLTIITTIALFLLIGCKKNEKDEGLKVDAMYFKGSWRIDSHEVTFYGYSDVVELKKTINQSVIAFDGIRTFTRTHSSGIIEEGVYEITSGFGHGKLELRSIKIVPNVYWPKFVLSLKDFEASSYKFNASYDDHGSTGLNYFPVDNFKTQALRAESTIGFTRINN